MKIRIWIWLVVLVAVVAAGWQIDKWKKQPPEISFARVTRETIASTVPTNGKVEPELWAVAHAERPGAVQEILIQRGQHVAAGAELLRLDTAEVSQGRAAAQARIDQIRAELDQFAKGGRTADITQITGNLTRLRLELTQAQNDLTSYQNLLSKQAATREEVTQRQQKVDDLKVQIQNLEDQKTALVSSSDRASAEARLRAATADLTLAEERLRQSVVRAPIEGEIYQFDLKRGAYLNAGEAVASIGRLDRVNVNVSVDERDLGRVKLGMPVTITWDALPKREWKGEVNKLPGQIVTSGSRQVGEVICLIPNPGRELIPGTNVNAEILSESVENVLTIPKEALRRDDKQKPGVFLLDGDHLTWRSVVVGVSNITRVQVQGIQEKDAIALISEKTLKDGMTVQPIFP